MNDLEKCPSFDEFASLIEKMSVVMNKLVDELPGDDNEEKKEQIMDHFQMSL